MRKRDKEFMSYVSNTLLPDLKKNEMLETASDMLMLVNMVRYYADAAEFGREPKEGQKLVRSLGGNQLCEIKVNTPRCCDPSTELYWSM